MHLDDSQALVIRRSMRKALGIKGKGNSPASCSLKIPLERWLSPAQPLTHRVWRSPVG